ncbi:YI31B-like protein [Mya arenaria]|uniref:YI31B-like protein n=1 Tax=Mya arenaria TaxID=6604 RepID=A0ABY7FGA6_MYAAR|nr:YI31B-like protein [Mya arenaria]
MRGRGRRGFNPYNLRGRGFRGRGRGGFQARTESQSMTKNGKFPQKKSNFSKTEEHVISQEIENLLEMQVIVEVCHHPNEYISPIFVIPKRSGEYRMILNLKNLNKYVEYHHFKMDTFESALKLVKPNTFFASTEIRHGYYSVPIAVEDQVKLRFIHLGKIYQYRALPNGISCAPKQFTKMMKPVYASLRMMGHKNSGYIDDSLLMGDTYSECEQNVHDTVNLMAKLGFMIHETKSVIVPTRKITFLGNDIDSEKMVKKWKKIVQSCTDLQKQDRAKIRDVARILGLLVSSFSAVEFGPLFYRTIECAKIQALQHHAGDYESMMSITESIKNELSWWIQNLSHQNRQIIHGNPDLIITTDASSFGWGAVSENESIGGRWDDTEIQNLINVLELFAASHALKSFCKTKSNIHVQIRSDNSCTVAYICHIGGKIEQLNNIAKHMWLWSKDRAIWLSATHVPGIANEADFSSRHFNENVEWKLAESVFSEAVNCFGLPEIDMFASRLNRQLDRFVSWKPDPDAEAVDAFSVCGTSNSESEAGQSRGLAGGTFLDNTEFFHQYSGNVDSRSIHSESGPGHIEITTNIESASFSQQTTSNAMSYIRRSYEKRNLSEKYINIIMASWRKTTQKQYSTYINRWIHFCREREIDPLQTPIEYCIEFLTELYDSGLRYETLNTARSAVSSLCKKQNGYNVGSHPLVIRFLSGVYNLRPTKPKYKETWDVSKVLCYLKALTPARQLSLKMLSYKLVMLIALTQASRSHSISLLTLDNMMKDSESYVLHYFGLLKQSRKGKVNPILKLNRYTLDSEICVYSTIAEYIEQTSGLRNGVRQLIISYIKPHKPVVSTTISRWIKFVLKSSSIDIDKYSSHSTRSAASSKVKASGLPIKNNEISWLVHRYNVCQII